MKTIFVIGKDGNPTMVYREPDPGRVINQPSLTVPDQTMTLRQLIERHVKGMPLMGNINQGYYDEGGDGVDVDSLDLVDRANYIQSKIDRLQVLQEKINTKKQFKADNSKSADDPMAEDKGKKGGENEIV